MVTLAAAAVFEVIFGMGLLLVDLDANVVE